MTTKPILPGDGPIEPVELRTALEERYLAYALSTIMNRALPDVRDGLKPVHRRILYAMRELRLNPEGGYIKCAKIVGEVMGDYHPHGNQAIYDALARLAQDFAVRYPLVDGQGNFGNIDGDNPAAPRYTEARLTEIANAILEGIDEDTVEFRPNYDGRVEEPVVLPAAFPNLLANGSSGIAVGMATNIPPHNVDELCAALLHLIKHPNTTIEKLVEFVPGPDFPTGGIIVEPHEAMLEAYKTGRGGFRVRARWSRRNQPRRLSNRRDGNSLPSSESQARRKTRRADERKETAAARRRSRRKCRRSPADFGAQEPDSRSGAADGKFVQAVGIRGSHQPQHERAVGGADSQRPVVARRSLAMARAPHRSSDPPFDVPVEENRASA